MAESDITVFFHPFTLGKMVEEGRVAIWPDGKIRFREEDERYPGLLADSSDQVEEDKACRQVVTYEPWA
jgi:hypothetical protein